MKTQSQSEKIAAAIDAAREFGATVATGMIEEIIGEAKSESRCEGVRIGRDQDSRIAAMWTWLGTMAAVGVAVGIVYGTLSIRREAEALDKKEIAACASGDYQGCMAGYQRNHESDEASKRQLYFSVYKQSTGKNLIPNEQAVADGTISVQQALGGKP